MTELTLLLLPVTALAAPPTEGLTVLGFSADGARFAVIVAAPGEPTGVLWQWDLATGKAQADKPVMALAVPVPSASQGEDWGHPLLRSLKLGEDRGHERYRSGSATATKFELGGAPFEVELDAGSGRPARVVLRRGSCSRALALEGDGTDANLSSVLSSRDGKAVAIITKYMAGEVRRFRITAGRIDGPLGKQECLAAALRSRVLDAACVASLMKLAGSWDGAKTGNDHESFGEAMHPTRPAVPIYTFSVVEKEGRPWLELFESFEAGMQEAGEVIGCSASGSKLRVTLSGDSEPGLLVVTPLRNGTIQVATERCWPVGNLCGLVDTFRRSQ